jgi:hypothetical protein
MDAPALSHEQQTRLKQLGVIALYLFGSRARGEERSASDYDYAVLTRERGHLRGGPLYMALYELLAAISPRTLANDVIDIVFLEDAPLELRFHVVRYGQVLYDADPAARLEFETRTTLLYCDFRPLLDEMDRAILERA